MIKIKIMLHLISLSPLCWLLFASFNRLLGGDPQEKLMHELGLWGLIFLLLTLSLTPAKLLNTQIPWLKFRRMLGLYTAFYAFLHLLTYFVFYLSFDFSELFTEIMLRPYITVGSLAFLGLLPLVLTSTRRSQRTLGKSWKKLHQSVYFIAALVIIHFIWQSKSDLTHPLYYLAWFTLLIIARWLIKLKKHRL